MQNVTTLKTQISTCAKSIATLTQILASGTLAPQQQQHVVANIKALHIFIKNTSATLQNLK